MLVHQLPIVPSHLVSLSLQTLIMASHMISEPSSHGKAIISLPSIREFYPEFNAPVGPDRGNFHAHRSHTTSSHQVGTLPLRVPRRPHSSMSAGSSSRTALDDMFPRHATSSMTHSPPALPLSLVPLVSSDNVDWGRNAGPSTAVSMVIPSASHSREQRSRTNSSDSSSVRSASSSPISHMSPHLDEQSGDSDDNSSTAESSKKHVCRHCLKRFNRPSSLRIHDNIHTGATPFQCPWPYCGRKFSVNSNMRRHLRNHATGGFTHARSNDLRSRHAAGLALVNPRASEFSPSSHLSYSPPSKAASNFDIPHSNRAYSNDGNSFSNGIHAESTSHHPPPYVAYSYRQPTAEYLQSHVRALPPREQPTSRPTSFRQGHGFDTSSSRDIRVKEEPRTSIALSW